MFLLVFFCFGATEYDVMVGAVSSVFNPFWSQQVPGIHICNGDLHVPVKRGPLERRLVLPLNNTNMVYEHCRVRTTRTHKEMIDALAVPETFIRFYIGTRTVRSPFAKIEENGNATFPRRFVLTVDNTKDVANPPVQVVTSEYLPVNVGEFLEFVFEMKYEEQEIVTPSMSYRSMFSAAAGLFCVSLLLAVFWVYRVNGANIADLVPYSEIWRIDNSMFDVVLVIAVATVLLMIGAILTLFCAGKCQFSPFIERAMVVAALPSAQIVGILGATMGLGMSDHNYGSPYLLCFIIVVMPQHVFGFLSRVIGGSFRGYGFMEACFNEGVALGLSLLVVRGSGYSAARIRSWFTVELYFGESKFALKGLPWFAIIFRIIYTCSAFVVVYPACVHIVDVKFNDVEVDVALLWACIAMYTALATFGSLARTIYRTSHLTVHWCFGHNSYHVVVALLSSLTVFYTLFSRETAPISLLSKLQFRCAEMMAACELFGTVLVVGSGVSCLVSMIIVLFSTSTPKSL